MKRKILWIWLSVLIVTASTAFAAKTPKLAEETILNLKMLKNSEVSEVVGLVHPNMEGYARITGIDLKQVLSVLKLSSLNKGNAPAYIGPNSRYKSSGFKSASVKLFELVRVQIGGNRKILALYNEQMLDENNIEKFHKGWILAELSDKYEVVKLHNLFVVSKHPWPGGEAIYTSLKIKKNNLQIALTYEQPIRGSEVHTECDYTFTPDEKGWLAFKGVKEFTMEGPMP